MSRLVKCVHIDLSRQGIPGIQSMDSSMDLFSSYKKSNKLNFYRKEVIDEVMVKEAQDLKNEVTVGMLLALCLFEIHLVRCRKPRFGRTTVVGGRRNSCGIFLRSRSRALEQRWGKFESNCQLAKTKKAVA